VAIGAIEQLLRDVDQRPSLRRLGLADDDAIDQLVSDTIDDAAIRNSPRLPTPAETREILVSVSG
jgi:alcohol dehydrogenase class IV